MKILVIIFILFSNIFLETTDKPKIIKKDSQKTEEINGYIKLYNKSYELLKMNYVDSIDGKDIIKSSIKGLMKPLDPYTKLLEGNSKENYDILRRGKYGGVGIQIGIRRDTLTVLAPMEDSPAYSEGIHAGDQIFMVDSTSTKGLTVKEAAQLIKGDIGTPVVLRIYRPSSKEKINFELFRDNIAVKHVPYWGVDDKGVGYIRITRFSKNCAEEFKNALLEISSGNNDLKGLIVDLRGNSGGLLGRSIKILDYLTDRGELLLSSKGRNNKSNKEWKSRFKPIIDIDIPIVVLINKSSASASEIVAGSLQDLDRAVIIGQKSFGKGLVQHMYDLNDTITLKITTSKYYLPSGRLVQKQDYLDNGFLTDGLDKKDSLFVSKTGRKLKGGGGITPDILTEVNHIPAFVNALWKEGAFLSFAAYYIPFHPDVKKPIFISSNIMRSFRLFLNDFNLEYKIIAEKHYDNLSKQLNKSSISINKYSRNISTAYNNDDLFRDVDAYIKQLKRVQYSLEENQKWIKNGLLRELSKVAIGEKERIRVSLFEDEDYIKAREIILDLKTYYKTLNLD